MLSFFTDAKKAVVAAVGVALTVLTFIHQIPFVPGSWETVVGVLIAVLTPVATWFAPGPTTKP